MPHVSCYIAGYDKFLSPRVAGILWPLEGIPKVIRYFSYLMPLTLPADSLRSVMSKGWGLTHPNVLMGLLVNTSWTIFFIVGCMLLFRL